LALLLAAQTALATIYATNPVASTTFTGGQTATISWEDDGTSPSLTQIGNASVGIYAGNSQQQTLLQMIIGSVNVATTASIQFTVDPTIGPNSNAYFIRFTALTVKDTTNPTYPYEQFSARFTMTGMTGTFNASVQAQINGATGAAAVPGASSIAPVSQTSTHPASNTPSPTASGAKTNATAAAKSAA
ncbi:hypothetical protein DACRYDRAFT_44073, partial [Dacryopinax primogenitus]